MSADNPPTQAEIAKERDVFVERMLSSLQGAFDLFSIYLGDRMGYYNALAGGGWLTSTDLAAQANAQERYTREWLEQQTVGGIMEVENEAAPPLDRRYRLKPGHIEPLVDVDSLNYVAPLARLFAGAVSPLPALLDAYHSGGGVQFDDYGADLHEGQAAINRPAFLQQLGTEWIRAMPDVAARLDSEPPARVGDIGCGFGWSAIGMARAFPKIQVDGFDLHETSIRRAHENARAHGVNDRVSFQVRDAGDAELAGKYDLVMALECVHDMSDPVAALKVMRDLAGAQGTVFIADERVADRFTAEGNDVERMMYGWSILHCLPAGMADDFSVGTGTVMRAETLKQYAREAGFSKVEILPIENFFLQFYRLTP